MKTYIASKIITVLIFGALLGACLHNYIVKEGQMSREDYLAKQAAEFDRYYANPVPLFSVISTSVILLGIGSSAYELGALILSGALKKTEGDGAK